MKNILIALLTSFLFLGCSTTNYNSNVEIEKKNISVGVVQKEIRIGMTNSDVVEVLGSPNIITTDSERREVWIYDKITSNVTSSSSKGYVALILMGATSKNSNYSSSQKTLTIIIKFDNENNVRDFSYRTSQF